MTMSENPEAAEKPCLLPAEWSKQGTDRWEHREHEIRLAIHHSKDTQLFTAIACSGEFFFSCSLLADWQTAAEEAGRLGTLLRTRLGAQLSVDADVSSANSPTVADLVG